VVIVQDTSLGESRSELLWAVGDDYRFLVAFKGLSPSTCLFEIMERGDFSRGCQLSRRQHVIDQ